MSNAMRFGKRTLAGVAAGALALGALTIASAPAVSAKTSVKPKAVYSTTATVGPVRVSYTGTTLESVPYTNVSWTVPNAATLGGTETAVVTLVSAPTPTAQLAIVNFDNRGLFATNTSASFTNAGDTAMLTQQGDAGVTVRESGTSACSTAPCSANIGMAANVAGTYTGFLTTQSNPASGPTDTNIINFSFTTTGAPTTMTLTPASQTLPASGAGQLTTTLRDAAGNITQPLAVDTVTTAPQTGTGGTFPALRMGGASASSSNYSSSTSLYDGVAVTTYTAAATAGLYSASVTPGGTLPSGGVTAQSASITVSGEVSSTAVTGLAVTVPTTAFADVTTVTAAAWQVPAGSTAVTVRATGTAGLTYRFAAWVSAGTVNGTSSTSSSSPIYVTVTPGADGRGTMAFTLGGNASLNTATLTLRQVAAAGTPSSPAVTNPGQIIVTQANPDVLPSTVYPTPYGSIVAALGTSPKVSVLVTDQFGNAVGNSVVRAYRSNTSGALLSTATTNALGVAEVTVSGATGITSGTTETYVFTATTNAAVDLSDYTLSVLYTTSGAVTAVSVSVTGGAQTPILNTTTAIATMPSVEVPYTGLLNGTPSSRVYTVATNSSAGTAGNYVVFTPSSTPANTVTVTVPTGLKVTEFTPAAGTTAWNSALAAQTVSVPSGTAVYVFGTKTGISDITFTSGAITATAKIRVTSPAAAAYNIALSPATQSLQENAFGTLKLTVTDAFGNPVAGAGTVPADGGTVVSVTGEALLGGTNNSATPTTGSDGSATLTVIAGRPGTAKFTAAPLPTAGNAWAATYVKPAGFPDPIKSATADLVITKKESRTIMVTGSGRTTVGGKPGVYADGDTDGFAEGALLNVLVRFPGQTTYTKGAATPAVDKSGAFSWERRTGKKTYVYFTSADGAITSNTVIIPAN